jgi:hypothetical protein
MPLSQRQVTYDDLAAAVQARRSAKLAQAQDSQNSQEDTDPQGLKQPTVRLGLCHLTLYRRWGWSVVCKKKPWGVGALAACAR